MSQLPNPQPLLSLRLERTGPASASFVDSTNNSPLYKVLFTDLGSVPLMKKPGFEVIRCTSSSDHKPLVVGTIRFGRKGMKAVKLPLPGRDDEDNNDLRFGKKGTTTVKFSLTGRKYEDNDDLRAPFELSAQKLQWKPKTTSPKTTSRQTQPNESDPNGPVSEEAEWAVEIECVELISNQVHAIIKLSDTDRSSGQLEIYSEEAAACVNDSSGDWEVLDGLVTMAYANIERDLWHSDETGPYGGRGDLEAESRPPDGLENEDNSQLYRGLGGAAAILAVGLGGGGGG